MATDKTTTVYKLTRPDMTTHGGFQWRLGETRIFPGTGALCTAGWAHAYTSPALALLLNPIHANYRPCRLFMSSGVIGATDYGRKVGCSQLTLIKELPTVVVTRETAVAFGILCVLEVYSEPSFGAWAMHWLSGSNRSGAAAQAAAWEAGMRAARAAAAAAKAAALLSIAASAFLPWEG